MLKLNNMLSELEQKNKELEDKLLSQELIIMNQNERIKTLEKEKEHVKKLYSKLAKDLEKQKEVSDFYYGQLMEK